MASISTWQSPLPFDDLHALSSYLSKHPGIVSSFPNLRTGQWQHFSAECIKGTSSFIAHIDSNFLGHLLSIFSRDRCSKEARSVAAVMAFAITFDIKINPNFATHEYAMSGGQDDPDSRLAKFYQVDNLHPKLYADIALGRRRNLTSFCNSKPKFTKHRDTFNKPLKGHNFVKTCLLKVVAIHTNPANRGKEKPEHKIQRLLELLDWMFYDFLLCGPVFTTAELLWGSNSNKTVLKLSPNDKYGDLINKVENATWDLNLAMNWSESESKRRPHIDPIYLLFTRDRALEQLAQMLLAPPTLTPYKQSELNDFIEQQIRLTWPVNLANRVLNRYKDYENRLDSSDRKWNNEGARPTTETIQTELQQEIFKNLAV
jgi:hypothetical protein